MTLGPIFLCCDDGEFYRVDGDCIKGCGWKIILEEFDDDFFEILNRSPQPGFPENGARPIVQPMELVQHDRIPIDSLDFVRNIGDYGYYAINWTGSPFPRRLLPEKLSPTRNKKKFTPGASYVLMSDEFAKLREEALS